MTSAVPAPRRQLGNSTLTVPPLTFGGNVFGWTIDAPTSFLLLDKLIDEGLNFIDTADVYSRWMPGNEGGESERIIGSWLKQSGKRDQVIIATKVGMAMGENKKGLGKAYIQEAVEASLRRLNTDYIDLYQSHEDDPFTPLEETLEAYAGLVTQGKVRVIGASNYSSPRLLEAIEISKQHQYPSYQSLQPHYNLYDRVEYEHTLEPTVLKHGIGVINYYALASGFLSGKYRNEADLTKSPRGQGVKRYLDGRGLRILDALDQVAARSDANPAQVALAWLIARPSITAPIASATTLAQLDDLIAATRLKLDPDAITLLNRASNLPWQS
ncbi:aldo/keto reductase [Glaciimonas immobilis]|uniref:Aryl-alcohol dehydrogenase-like predicted oxidoreductase n=1 Tax=Glaciimonas immobilis TaxID=728004 RepID=A0A840RZY5_9BURK|nr:aldo/keto reductase [Glaciimonas immobilis]KAF3996179.1 aldo/keto reductase [Glaciimonas immobilis]MBB5202668.1 aryl-alcohol dehydrogenase-like predicted oxidoreductase [Glaciimonas immobilis]